jgi:hypothetical protein
VILGFAKFVRASLLTLTCVWLLIASIGCAKPAVSQSIAASVPVQTVPLAPAPARFADEPTRSAIKHTLTAGKPINVVNEFGEVRVRFGGFSHVLEATAVAQAPIGSLMPVMQFDEASATLSAKLPPIAPGNGGMLPLAEGQRIDITLFIPEKHDLAIRTLRGLVEVRGLRANLQVRSESGDLLVRSITGALDIETGSGLIEAAFADQAIPAAQRVVTSTGAISVSFGPAYDAALSLATSGLFATEYSLNVTPQPGSEPNKSASVTLGRGVNPIEIRSKRGDVRLFRRPTFIDADSH